MTIHGCLGEEDVAYIGGKDNQLKERIANELNQIGVEVKAPSHMSGVQDDNIVNTKMKLGYK